MAMQQVGWRANAALNVAIVGDNYHGFDAAQRGSSFASNAVDATKEVAKEG